MIPERQEKAPSICAHCGLPVPEPRQRADASDYFCCNGCEAIYQAIHQHGLSHFYQLRAKDSVDQFKPARYSGADFSYFDDATFVEQYTQETSAGSTCVTLYLEGVHCSACVWLIEKLPELLSGVCSARLDFARAELMLEYQSEQVALSEIASLLDKLGYTPHPANPSLEAAIRRNEDRRLLLQLGVAAICFANTMVIAVSLYQGLFTGIDATIAHFFRWVSLVLTLPAILYSGQSFFRSSWGALCMRRLHIDLPISLGIIIGFSASVWNTIVGSAEVYFDSLCMLIFLLLLGRWLQRVAVQRAVASERVFDNLLPLAALRVKGTQEQQVYTSSLCSEDLVRVPTDGVIPVDGVLESSRGTVDNSILTGESRPISVTPGSSVFAGTRNTGAALMVRVRQVGATTRLGRLIELLRLNAKDRATIIEVTDRLGGWFVIAVLGLAGASFYYWSSVSLEKAVAVTVSLLVISCPCALGLSAPVCLSVAVARAARHGILIRGKDVIERITRVKRIFFDKTGTVTSGTPSVVVCEPPLSVQAKRAIAQLERDSEHPYARALRYYVDSTAAGQAEFSVESYPGKGVQGTDSSGDEWQIGSVSWLTDQILDSPIDWRTHVAELKSRCLSPIIVCRNAEVVAVIGVGDDLKTGIDHVIHELESSGREVHLLSGDDPQITSVVAHALKIPCERAIGGASPEEKIAIVAESSRVTPTLMIGDGVNDAAALHAATVGVGVRGGAENCLVAADVFLQEPDAEQIAQLFSGAQRTMAIVHRNLLLSLIYNVVGAGAAICGVVDPLFAALLMPLSSVTVVVSSVFSKSY